MIYVDILQLGKLVLNCNYLCLQIFYKRVFIADGLSHVSNRSVSRFHSKVHLCHQSFHLTWKSRFNKSKPRSISSSFLGFHAKVHLSLQWKSYLKKLIISSCRALIVFGIHFHLHIYLFSFLKYPTSLGTNSLNHEFDQQSMP
jgi:hypothetical protein